MEEKYQPYDAPEKDFKHIMFKVPKMGPLTPEEWEYTPPIDPSHDIWVDGRGYDEVNLHNPMRKRQGGSIETYTGKRYYPLDPQPDDFCIEDISHALSNICRFGGHVSQFYSVAEHSVHVANLLYLWYKNKSLSLAGLFHDASEAYLIDIPKDIKPHLTNYKALEKATQDVIDRKFCYFPDTRTHDMIKKADECALQVEANVLMLSKGEGYTTFKENETKLDSFQVWCLTPDNAKRKFMLTYNYYK